MSKKWVLLTNDDGIEAPGFEMLVKSLNKRGIAIIAFAPSTNKSACSMQINPVSYTHLTLPTKA